jgi:hypothetical protein
MAKLMKGNWGGRSDNGEIDSYMRIFLRRADFYGNAVKFLISHDFEHWGDCRVSKRQKC